MFANLYDFLLCKVPCKKTDLPKDIEMTVAVSDTRLTDVLPRTVLQLGFEGRGVWGRALFAWSYKNESTMRHLM